MKNIAKLTLISLLFLCPEFFAQEDSTFSTDSLKEAFTYASVADLREQLDDIFNDPNFSHANWGVIIQSFQTGEYFYKRNEDKLFIPASNLKILTSAAGLLLLGENYRFSTDIYYSGKIYGSVLQGNLIVRGKGDPTISGRFFNGRILKVFEDWADSLLKYGIDEIRGNIIGDDNYFDDQGLGYGWAWNHESFWFSAQSGAISLNDNCVDLLITVNKDDSSVTVDHLPETNYVVVFNNVTVNDKSNKPDVNVFRERGTNLINVFGTVPFTTDTIRIFATVNNPTQYAMVVLRDILISRGISVKGSAEDIDNISESIDYYSLPKLFTYYSPELHEIIKIINKESSNFYAEQLLKTIGYELEGLGSAANGIKWIKAALSEMGINPESLIIKDGSGLSPYNLISPRHIISVLKYIYKSKLFTSFYNSLPVAGKDGTLGKRMLDSRAEGNVRAKTGFLENVKSFSGYLKTGDDELIAFSMILNDYNLPGKLVENLQDLVCLRLVNFKRK